MQRVNWLFDFVIKTFIGLKLFFKAGANQVRWNRLSRNLLATAHNGDIRLWDQRKGTAPVEYITAHLANVGILRLKFCFKYVYFSLFYVIMIVNACSFVISTISY